MDATAVQPRCLRATLEGCVEHRPPDGGAGAGGQPVAAAIPQPLSVFQQAQFLGNRRCDVAVRADTVDAAQRGEIGCGEDAVAKIGFRCRTQAGDSAGARQPCRLFGRHVGRVDGAPPAVDRHLVQQEFHRAPSAPGDAVFDFAFLLGDVDMDRAAGLFSGEDRPHLVRGGCTQRMDREAERCVRCGAFRLQGVEKGEELIDVMDEGALPFAGLGSAKAGMGVKHRQMGQADAGRLRGADDP